MLGTDRFIVVRTDRQVLRDRPPPTNWSLVVIFLFTIAGLIGFTAASQATVFQSHEQGRRLGGVRQDTATRDRILDSSGGVIRVRSIALGDPCAGCKDEFDGTPSGRKQGYQPDYKSVAVYYDRGLEYRRKGDNSHAIADFNSAIRLDPGYADAYGARGNAYADIGDRDRAIADYNEAIRLNPAEALTYHNRGLAHVARGDDDRAIADYNEAIRLDPRFVGAYDARGLAHKSKGEIVHAIADYSEAIKLDPKYSSAYFDRGRAYLYSGALAPARGDFREANELDPKFPYSALWLDLAERRGNWPRHLAEFAKQLDMRAWPAPVVRLFLGKSSLAQTLAVVEGTNAKTMQAHLCEANFYGGEWELLQGAKEEAQRLFRRAVGDCPHEFIEWDSANSELKMLGAAP